MTATAVKATKRLTAKQADTLVIGDRVRDITSGQRGTVSMRAPNYVQIKWNMVMPDGNAALGDESSHVATRDCDFLEKIDEQVEAVVALREVVAKYREFHTRLAWAAYRKGVNAALNREGSDPPYPEKHALPNYMRGENNPRPAFAAGYADGQRILALLDGRAVYPEMRQAEYKALPERSRLALEGTYAVTTEPEAATSRIAQ